jgi:hypothetical protein
MIAFFGLTLLVEQILFFDFIGEFSMFSAGSLNRKKRKKGRKNDAKRQGSNHEK